MFNDRKEPIFQSIYRKIRRHIGRISIALVILLTISIAWANFFTGDLWETIGLATDSDIATESDIEWKINRRNAHEVDFGSDTTGPGVMGLETSLLSSGSLLSSSATTTVTATLTWQDGTNAMGIRPSMDAGTMPSVELNYGDDSDTLIGTVASTGNNVYTITWENVPTEYNGTSISDYQISIPSLTVDLDGDGVNDYGDYYTYSLFSGSGDTYTATASLNAKSYNAYLSFNNASAINYGSYFEKPDYLMAYLVDESNNVVDSLRYDKNTSNQWGSLSKFFYVLTRDLAGNPINSGDYSVLWEDAFSNNPQYRTVTSNRGRVGVHNPMPTPNGLHSVYPLYRWYYNIPITWNDDDNTSGTRPSDLSLQLYRLDSGGNLVPLTDLAPLSVDVSNSSSTITTTNPWRALPRYDTDGSEIQYYLVLEGLPVYYSSEQIDESLSASYGKTILKHTAVTTSGDVTRVDTSLALDLNTQSMTATVKWEGDGIGTETEMTLRPSSVLLKLYYTTDDGATWQEYWGDNAYSVSVGANQNEWTYTWNALPATDSDGNPIKFRVEQASKMAAYATYHDNPVYNLDLSGNATHTTQTIRNSYEDNWNYSIDLYWDRSDPAEKYDIYTVTTSSATLTTKYILTVNTQKAYDTGDLQIELPYELFDARTGNTGNIVSGVSLGNENNPTQTYNFTYRIDNNGTADTSDDKIIFYNYKPLSAAENIQITVQYNINPNIVVDLSRGELVAKASGQYVGQGAPELQESNTISYTLDTGVRFSTSGTSKTNQELIRYWKSGWGEQPADFDPTTYNYVLYRLYTSSHGGNQPGTMTIVDTPADSGEVIRVMSYSATGASQAFTTTTSTDAGGNPVYSSTWSHGHAATGGSYTDYYYVLVRYPRTASVDPITGQTTYTRYYSNTASYTMTADDVHPGDKGEGDKNDVISTEKSASVLWEDYVFNYTGAIYNASKSMSTSASSSTSAPLTALEYGVSASIPYTISMNVFGYNFVNGYSMELMDDAVYVNPTIGGTAAGYTRLTEDDYEMVGVPNVTVTSTRLDRTNGQTLDGYVPTDPFTLWGRKGNTGAWENLGTFTMTSANATTYQPAGDLTDQGYTALRVTSPEGLQDHFAITLAARIRIKPSSPLFATWLANGDAFTTANLQNFGAFNYYLPDNNGDYRWANPYTSTSNTMSRDVGLDAVDRDEKGSYQRRQNYGWTMNKANLSSYMSKSAAISYDVTKELVSVRYTLTEYESIDSRLLPDELYEAHSQDDGIFYDLLPYGYTLDTSSEIAVRAYQYQPAAVDSVQTIDDYKGTGRQLVIIKVASLRGEGQNWYNYSSVYRRSGFVLSFTARAAYKDITSGLTQYNISSFQRGDGQDIWRGASEQGYPGTSQNLNIYIDDETGQPALRDLDGDGIIDSASSLYAYTAQTPNYIQTVETGLKKFVRALTGYYVVDDTVDIGADYSYKITFTSTANGTSKDVVIYDILENAENTGGASGEGASWKGKLKSVNTLNARGQGIDPVVYYSTTPNLTYNSWPQSGYVPEDDPAIWSTTPPSDLSTVTALAFDLRTALDGTEYVFTDKQSVSIEIFMSAPESLQSTEYAYNRPAYNVTYKANGSFSETTSLNISTRTTLQLRDLQDYSFTKVYENDGQYKALGGVVFRLYRCSQSDDPSHVHTGTPGSASSCWGSTIIQTASSASDGTVTFTDLDSGKYAIYEYSTRSGFTVPSYRYWVIDVNAVTGTVSGPVAHRSNTSTAYPLIEMVKDTEDFDEDGDTDEELLENPRPKKNIRVSKYWYDDSGSRLIRPTKLTVELYRNDVLFDTKEFTLTSTNNSYVLGEFNNLYVYDEYGVLYTYKVVEKPVPGYEAVTDSYTVSNTSTWNYFTFNNRRQGILNIQKLESNADTSLEYDFTVTLKDSAGNPIPSLDAGTGEIRYYTLRRYATASATIYTEEQVQSDANGIISFKLKNREYVRLINLPLSASYTVAEAENVLYTGTVTSGSLTGTTNFNNNPSVTVSNYLHNTTLPNTGSTSLLRWLYTALLVALLATSYQLVSWYRRRSA